MDAARVLGAIRRHLDESGHPFAFAGAFALNALGMGRATADLDLVVPFGAQRGLIKMLEDLGFETLHRSRGFSNHVHTDPDLGRIDLIYVEEPTASKLFSACSAMPFMDGKNVLVLKAEHLIAMKVHAINNDPQRKLRDLADVQYLLTLPGVDRDEARGYFERAGLLEEWNEVQPKQR